MVEPGSGVFGRLRRSLAGQLGWLLGHRAPRFCSAAIPPIAESTSTRLVYLAVLSVGCGGMSGMLTPSVQHHLQAAFKDFNATCIDLDIGDNCMILTGYMALYKVSFGISMFFSCMALLNVGVTSSVGVRASLHNGFWAWKVLVLLFLCATTFVIPVPHLDSFHTGWLYCALGGACVFLLVQMVLVTDFARGVSVPRPLPAPPTACARWVSTACSLAASLVLTLAWVGAYIWLFLRYTGASCMSTNTIIITCNGALSVLVCILTILPCTKRSTGGLVPALLQSAIVCCYLTYLTWCTVTSTPHTTRDPTDEYFRRRHSHDFLSVNLGPYHAGLQPYHDLEIPDTKDECEAPAEGNVEEKWVPYTAIVIMMVVLVYNSVTSWTSSPAKVVGLKLGEADDDPGLCICCRASSRREPFPPGPPATEEDGGQHVIRNERIQTVYSYALFHLTMCLANMYVTMQLTQWFQPQESKIISFNKSWSTVILKTVSSWVSVLVYLSTLVVPTWRPLKHHDPNTGSEHIPADMWASEETACLQTSHI